MICAPNPTRILMLVFPRAYYNINMPEMEDTSMTFWSEDSSGINVE